MTELDYGDEPLTEEEKRVEQFKGDANQIVANAFDMMVDNRWPLSEYLEYIEEMDPADFRKYYGRADLAEAKRILTSEPKPVSETAEPELVAFGQFRADLANYLVHKGWVTNLENGQRLVDDLVGAQFIVKDESKVEFEYATFFRNGSTGHDGVDKLYQSKEQFDKNGRWVFGAPLPTGDGSTFVAKRRVVGPWEEITE